MVAEVRPKTGQDRLTWVDYSKGICIVAVVCFYATLYEDAAAPPGWLQHWVDFARPFRMPAFFLLSGLFLSRTIDGPWRQYLDTKVVHFAYFFALWTTIYFALEVGLGGFQNPLAASPDWDWADYLALYVAPFRMLWFIGILPIFFVVTRLLKTTPWYLVLPAAAVLQILDVETGYVQLDNFCERYVYFYAGSIFAPLVFRFGAWAERNGSRSVLLLAGWAIVNEALVLAGHGQGRLAIVTSFVGAGAVVVAGCLLSRSRWMGWLRYLGQNSIVVFLSFLVFTTLTVKFLDQIGLVDDAGTRQPVVALAGILGPVLVFWLLRGAPAQCLFVRPAWARLAAARAPRAQPAIDEPAPSLADRRPPVQALS